jgi:hypothetical protein
MLDVRLSCARAQLSREACAQNRQRVSAGQPEPVRLLERNLPEAHGVARPQLREQRQIDGDRMGDFGITAERLRIGHKHDGLAVGRHLDRPGRDEIGSPALVRRSSCGPASRRPMRSEWASTVKRYWKNSPENSLASAPRTTRTVGERE